MSADAPEFSPSQGARLQEVIAGKPGIVAKLKRSGVFALKLGVGAFLCSGMFGLLGPLSFVGAVLATGWTYRLMQRKALQVWWKRSPEWYDGVRFETLTSTSDDLRHHHFWPNWLRGERWFSSLVANFKVGVAAVLNSYVLTIIPGLIWYLTWEAGWDNSFNFGYEQSFVNPSRYIFGMILFILVMLYLPMAQARQAVTGDWRAFYEFRTIRRMVRRRWFGCLMLATLYAVVSVPVTALKVAPYFLAQSDAAFIDLPAVEQLSQLRGFLFFSCLIVFPAFVLVHVYAARLYAGAAREELQAKNTRPVGFENLAVEKLHIDLPDPQRERSAPTRFILWTGTFTGRMTAFVLVLLVWFGFTFQIVLGQFLKFEAHPVKGWINQPLVQMPWFDLAPSHLVEAASEE